MTAFNLLDLDTVMRTTMETDLAGLENGVYLVQAPPDKQVVVGSLPYIVFFPEEIQFDDTFDLVAADVVYQIQVYDHKHNGLGSLSAIWDALIGDAAPPAKATSGFHRRQLTVTGDNSVTEIAALTAGRMLMDDSDAIGFFMRFQTTYQKG